MTPPTPVRRRPPGRYDEPSPLRARAAAAGLVALAVAGVAALLVTVLPRFTAESVSARVIDFQVRSDRSVVVDLEVAKAEGGAAYCVLRARGSDGREVGREAVVVAGPGTPGRTVRLEHDLATTARAVTGESAGCSPDPIPSPPVSSGPVR